jgi:alpha-tubulin suppressor-like RCC1 family protein
MGDVSSLTFVGFSQTKSVLDISAGGEHVCVLRASQPVAAICWGSSFNGQLGILGSNPTSHKGDDPDEISVLAPIAFKVTHSIAQVAAMLASTCALFTNGRIICWGKNDLGQLGRNDVAQQGHLATMTTLDFIDFSDLIPAIQISGTRSFACALFLNRRVRCFGDNTSQNLGDTTTFARGSSLTYPLSSSVFVTFKDSINSIPIEEVYAGM